MSIHIAFKNMKHSEPVIEHAHEEMRELLQITENKFTFHLRLIKDSDEWHHAVINCSYMGKSLSSNASHENLYKAIKKSVDSMKIQILRKAQKSRHH